MILSKRELTKIKAGAGVSGNLLNYIIRGFNSVLDVGRYLGSAIRRLSSNSYCPTR